jgi:hypothetical protein
MDNVQIGTVTPNVLQDREKLLDSTVYYRHETWKWGLDSVGVRWWNLYLKVNLSILKCAENILHREWLVLMDSKSLYLVI